MIEKFSKQCINKSNLRSVWMVNYSEISTLFTFWASKVTHTQTITTINKPKKIWSFL